MEPLLFLSAPFAVCFILVGIHCYLGLHVLARGVIFVDLALAQMATLGGIIAFLFQYEHDHTVTYFTSLGITILAAFTLAIANKYRKTFSQEAFIGVLYAFAAALGVLLVDKMSHGAEHIKHVLVGQILWVTWADVAKIALIYSLVSILHYLFRKPLLENSFGKAHNWKWDFLFYILFGVVITSSVYVAGVLLVFSFLIVPALLSSVFFTGITQRFFFGWFIGTLLSLLGLFLSYQLDMPSGALIVVVFTSLPILLVYVLGVFGKKILPRP